MNFQPLGNRVLVEIDVQVQTKSGLYIPQTAATGARFGKVVAVGTSYPAGSMMVEHTLKVGERVVIDEIGGLNLAIEGTEYLIVRNEEILGRVA